MEESKDRSFFEYINKSYGSRKNITPEEAEEAIKAMINDAIKRKDFELLKFLDEEFEKELTKRGEL